MSEVEKLKIQMLDYIKSYMIVNSIYQVNLAEIAGVEQAAVSKTLSGKSSIAPVMSMYFAVGGEISGVKESKEKLVKSFLSGDSNAIR